MKFKYVFLLACVVVSLSYRLNAAPMFNDNPVVYGKIKVQSWKARRDFNIVKQDLDFSCGAASVATLLNNFYGQTLTEEEVLKKLDKEQMRASFEDMRRIMPDLGFEAKGYALSFEQLAQLKIPVIVYLKYRKDDHFSVLRGIDGNTVLLADPSLGHVSMSRAQFLDAWQTREGNLAGKILAVVPKKAETISNKLFFTHHPKRQTEFAVRQIRQARAE
ncbi:peptidase%2C C39 family [Neisseria meningitidis]|uniref:Colicin V secretion/processing ATP-binding protein cvaB n=50 Tax=Neisseria meningitidis TaxID=487 RepID=A0AAC9GDC0_NEIME|nr:peptidase C39 [Neisseria meningitidis]ANW89812.1 Colicin V secretion/processing ATP-binding protein cvaB [Neisseria meningitidis]ANW91348.1 Colicin V secretion/processing ATP-binding protein cvaB [Neisseria meningitidis]ANW93451.1 Colicin V secretion/processing ATP-binding protein cvaB [Neisseria meningitidis]ANX16497.1 peptidase C39 [Neisseria meningitidis]